MANLLDQASIVLTPTAYDNGKVLCAKPSEPPYGDFDFSRNSAATRVNAQGLVENVQILSSNLVQNGSFSEEGVQEVSNGSFSQEGVELVTNGSFDTDSDWNKGTGWAISGGLLNASSASSNCFQSSSFVLGKTYKLTYSISNYVSGSFRVTIGSTGFGQNRSSNGTFVEYIVYSGANFLYLRGSSSFTGSIDNVSVREVGQDWEFSGGAELTEQGARINNTITGANAFIKQVNSNLTIGKSIVFQYDVVETNGKNLAIEQIGGNIALNTSTIGNNKKVYFEFDRADASLIIKRAAAATDVTITNISVKEVGQNWSLGTGWSIGDDKAVANTTGDFVNLYQNSVFVVGKTYKTTFTIVDYTQGSVRLTQGGIDVSGFQNAVGTYTAYFTATQTSLYMQGYQSFIGSITNITIIEITDDTNLPRINYEGFSYQDALGSELVVNGDFSNGSTDWVVGSDWSISGGTANALSANGTYLTQTSLGNAGKNYLITFTILNYVSGSCAVRFENISTSFNSNGTYTFYTTLAGIRNLDFIPSNFTGSIDNVSVKEYLGQEVVPDSGCGSWLFEPQTTQLLPYSEDFSQYSTGSSPIITGGFLAPDGTNNAYKITNSGSSTVYLSGVPNLSSTSTRSIYARSVSGTGTATLMSYFGNTIATYLH